MSAISVLRPMRIVAIPLTRPGPRIGKETLHRLTYYQFQLHEDKKPPSHDAESKPGDGKDKTSRLNRRWLPEGGVTNWATQKVVNMWTGFGQAEGGWKLRVYRLGQRLVDRTEFEELALKSFDPSLGPSISLLKQGPARAALSGKTQTTIPLLYPPSELSPSTTLSELRAYAQSRIPRHRNGLYLWLCITPFTFPLKLIPIIPNLPFFFCVWRSWSHYRAYKSSQYLQSLLENNLITPEPSEVLDQIYKKPQITSSLPASPSSDKSSSSDSQTDQDSEPRHTVILNHEDVPKILSLLSLKPDSPTAADLRRAIEQARIRASSGRI